MGQATSMAPRRLEVEAAHLLVHDAATRADRG